MIGCAGPENQLPNIVLIFMDDLGYADIGCFGAKGYKTPNIDKIAEEGIRFTSFYASQAVCSASRASLMTGCYAERVSIRGALGSRSQTGLHPEEETIAAVLKKKGYATGIFGKWHLGKQKEFLPLQHGFDEYFGLPYSNDMWPVEYGGKPSSSGRKSLHPPLCLIEGNEKVEEIKDLEDQSKLTAMYTERAVRFINKNKKRPFFLYLPHSMVHVPIGAAEKFRGKSVQGLFGDVMMEVDWSVGEIRKTLRKNGLDNNTLLIFTSDNGPWLNFGNHAGSALPLREGKGNMWEGGPRVPCVMKWPGRIEPGSVCEKTAATIDLLPTFAALTGASLPEKEIDGVSILPLLEGDNNSNPRDSYYYYYGGSLIAVRKGKWKLVFPHTYRSYKGVKPGKDGLPGPYARGEAGLELYDLENDISEKQNVIKEYPEVLKELNEIAEKARQELGDFLTNRKGKNVREPGRAGGRKAKKIVHSGVGKTVKYNEPFHVKYHAGGEKALVNGMQGSSDYMDGFWQGFEGNNLDINIDLGTKHNIKEILCSFLQVQASWIFLPEKVEISVSADGGKYNIVKSFEFKPDIDPEIKIKECKTEGTGDAVKYIRIKARNVGKCPEWHQGAGGKSWIFTDEVVIR